MPTRRNSIAKDVTYSGVSKVPSGSVSPTAKTRAGAIEIAPAPNQACGMTSIQAKSSLLRRIAQVAGAILAVYLLGRGVGELFVIHYGNSASYEKDWGGPSLAGVLAVHSGPAVLIIAGSIAWWRRRSQSRASRSGDATYDLAG
jgi:hypothetical protein